MNDDLCKELDVEFDSAQVQKASKKHGKFMEKLTKLTWQEPLAISDTLQQLPGEIS